MSAPAPSLDPSTRQRLEARLHALESDRGSNWPLLAGLLASLLFHSSLMVPQVRNFFSSFHAHDGVDRTRAATFSVEKEMEKRPPTTPEQQQVEDEELAKLGIEDGTTQSTMTWIGYNEYQEHIARLSKVDQAAFRDTDEGGQPMPAARPSNPSTPQVPQPEMAAPPSPDINANPAGPALPAISAPPQPAMPQVPPPSPAQPTQPQPAAPPPPPASPADTRPVDPTEPKPVAVPPETAATMPTKPAKDAEPIPSADENRVAPQLQPVEKAGTAKDLQDAAPPPQADQVIERPPAQAQPKPEDTKPQDTKPDQPPPDQSKPEEAKPDAAKPPEATTPPPPQQPPQQPAQPAQPSPATAPPTQAAPGATQASASPTTGPSPDPSARPGAKPGPKADGDLSDRESDATSVTAAPTKDWKSGKPLAAKGIKVNTKRPELNELQTISTNPANPLALVEFNKSGQAVSATILESTGYDNVDQAIIDSLYEWTADVAKSPKVQALPPGQTFKFKIRLLMR